MKFINQKLIIIAFVSCCCESARILSIIPFPMRSHEIVYKPLLLELAKRGHNVTAISPYPSNKNSIDPKLKNNYREIVYESDYKDIHSKMDFYRIRSETRLWSIGWWDLFDLWDLTYYLLEDIYENIEVNQILTNSNNNKFDLIICEGFFGFESLFAFGELFKAPVINVATFGTTLYINEHTGNPWGSSYYPVFLLPYTDEMNVLQRLHNFILTIYTKVTTYLYHIPNQEKLIRKYFNPVASYKMPPLTEMLKEVSLIFLNTQTALGIPRPNLPNIIEIGGLHIQPNSDSILDEDLQNLMDKATQGVIYFSLGSNVNISKMPEKYVQVFIETFAKLGQLVLWKWEDKTFPGQSKNVHISRWFPQQQILAHKNCLAFVTHGGMLSLQESVYYGVPVIGIPFFGDQPMNMLRVEKINFGIMLEYDNITHESLSWSLNEIITNSKYKETARRLSSLFRDNVGGSPLERAVYWVEYVLRYNGAPHLRSPARLQPFYKYLLLDAILILILAIAVLGYVINLFLKLFVNILNKISNKDRKNKSE